MPGQIVTDDHWFSSLPSESTTKLNIFFFPHAGGGTQAFRTWQECLPPSVGCYLIHLPGREQRLHESPFHRMEPLVQQLRRAIQHCLATPFVFFGHSMGALISFELVRELRRHQLPLPLHLFASACTAPQMKDWYPPIHALSDSDLLGKIHAYAMLPREVLFHRAVIQAILPALRADFAVCETYQYLPERPLDCPIAAFGGIEDSYISYEGIAAWRMQTSLSFTMRMFPGDHFFLHSAKAHLLQVLREDIAMIVERL